MKSHLNKQHSFGDNKFTRILLVVANIAVFLGLVSAIVITGYRDIDYRYQKNIDGIVLTSKEGQAFLDSFLDAKTYRIRGIIQFVNSNELGYNELVNCFKSIYSEQERIEIVSLNDDGFYEGIEITSQSTCAPVSYENADINFVNTVLNPKDVDESKPDTYYDNLPELSCTFSDPLNINSTEKLSCLHVHIKLEVTTGVTKTFTILSMFETRAMMDSLDHVKHHDNTQLSIIDKNGDFLATFVPLHVNFSNFFDYVAFYNNMTSYDKETFITEFHDLEKNQYIEYFNSKGRKTIISRAPNSTNDWYTMSIIEARYITPKTDDTRKLLWIVLTILMLIVIFDLILLNYFNSKLKEAVSAIEKDNKRIEDANKAKSDFLSKMSHDVRTPLNGILGLSDIALNHLNDKETIKDSLNKIETASNYLLTLINDVLDLSAIEAGKFGIRNSPMNVKGVLENINSIAESKMKDKNITYIVTYGQFKNLFIMSDPLRWRQIAINIIGNAMKYTPDGGTVKVSMEELPNKGDLAVYRFICEDTGIGMSKEFLEHIYDDFSQENSGARTTMQGTGLGMAITKQIVDLLNGTIEVESEVGVGSKFTVTIPAKIAKNFVTKSKTKTSDIKNMKLLIVEDNELNMQIANRLLHDKGCIIFEAYNGKEALEFIRKSKPGDIDAILMDVMMPGMDGIETTKEIRKLDNEYYKNIPIIAMTANAFEEDKQKSIDAGMNEHVSKPIDFKALSNLLYKYYHK